MSEPVAPIKLAANQPPQFYRGGESIAAFRAGSCSAATVTSHGFGPEDWVASTTTLFGHETRGLSALPDGRWLRDAVRADPTAWLGENHVAAFTDSTALLVKLLDAGQRLPVHFHPSDSFARRHFNAHFGKNEAWVVLATSGDDPRVYLGFSEPVPANVIQDWVHRPEPADMVSALGSMPVRAGDTVYIPAGLPHAIGHGVFLVELQQPVDFSLTLEWRGFLDSEEKGHLGIGFARAIEALDTSEWGHERLATLVNRTEHADSSTVDLLVPEAASYFRAQQLRSWVPIAMDPSFAVLVVLDGTGTLRTERDIACPVSKGDTLVVAHAAGHTQLEGDVTVIRCQPPDPERVMRR